MGVTLLQPLSVGNAVRVFMHPEPGALFYRLLRRTADVFTGADDTGAVVVADQCTDDTLLDLKALVNGTAYFYRAFHWTGTAWLATPSVSATPAATYVGDTCDPQTTLIERLEAGLAVEVARGALQPPAGRVPVFKSPFVAAEALSFPNVICHLDLVEPTERFLGDDALGLDHLPDGDWQDHEGYLARWSINIAVVSQSADERTDLRRALVRILQANLPVFAAAGMITPSWTLSDSEDLESKTTGLFMSGGSFTCLSHSFVATGPIPSIRDLPITLTPLEPYR